MVKSHNQRLRAVIGIMFMLATSPLSVNYVHADDIVSKTELSEDFAKELSKSDRKDRMRSILTEQIVDGKLRVRHFEVSQDATSEDIREIVSFEGKTTGWALVKGKAYSSGIVLYDGKIIRIDDQNWRVTTQGSLEVGGRNLELDLSGCVHDSNVILHGTATNDDLEFRVIFSGKIAETDSDGVYALAFTHVGLKSTENGPSVKLYQIGNITLQNENLDSQNSSIRYSNFMG